MAFSWSLPPKTDDDIESVVVTAENALADGDITTLPDFMMMASRLGIDGPRIFEAFNLDSSFYDCIAMGGQFQVFKHTEFGYDGRGGSHIVKRVCPMLYKNKTPNSLRDLRLEVQVLAQQVVRRHPNIIDLIAWGYDYPHPVTEKMKQNDEERYPRGIPIPVLLVQEALCSMDNFFHSPDFDAAENLSWNTRCHLAIGVAAGLECLHKIEVLHNDLKPGNILICRQDNQSAPFTSKLADFGMSVTEAKSFREYGRTQGWRPPEARDYESRKHGKFSNEVLFKSESFAYGLVAIYAICCGPRQIQHLSEDQDERQACTLELLSSQPSFSIEDKSEALAFYSAVEQNFLLEHPEDRKRVSPQTLELSVSVRNDWNTAFDEMSSKASNLAASRTRPHDAMSFYRNRGSTLLRDLERADVDTYPGDLLFEMAVAKGVDFDPRHGIDYDGMLKLVNKSTKTKVPSLAGTGVVAQIFSAFTSSTRPPPLIAQRDLVAALHTAVSSGSISARATLGDIAPQLLPGAMNAFQSYGAYNRESLLIRQDFDDLVSFPLADLDDAALIRKVSSLPAMRSTHNTDLHIAALLGKHKLIRMLIDKPGVNIDSPNAAGETPLYKACLAGQYESARVLLENGANPCVRVSPLEISCLHWLFAFPCHQMENVLSLLVAKGLEINARVLPANETTPKRYSWTGSLHFPFHWPAGTPIHWAAHAESREAVDVLMRHGAAVDELTSLGDVPAQTALSMAMYRGSVKMVAHLLKSGASAIRIDDKGCSQLHLVVGNNTLCNTLFPLAKHFMQWCSHGSFENALESTRFCVNMITTAGISIDFERPIGQSSCRSTPLLDAVDRGNAVGVIALLERGANANYVESYSKKLPLHIWVETNLRSLAYPDAYLAALRMLLEHTANPEQRDDAGQSVIHAAIVGADATVESDVILWKQKLHLLLKYCPGLGIDDRDKGGKTLLLHVTNYDSRHGWNVLPVIDILQKDFGADIRVRDNDNCDFLWHVSRKGGLGDARCLHAIQLYLNLFPAEQWASVLNASKNSETKRTALMCMVTSAYSKCVSYALDHGADPNDTDQGGETALGLSIELGNTHRLALFFTSSIFLNRMPKADDSILEELFYNGEQVYDSSAWAGEAKGYYFACPMIRDALIQAGAQTGKQLGTTKIAPAVKFNEKSSLEELGWWDSFCREEQPFYEMWKISYDFDDTQV